MARAGQLTHGRRAAPVGMLSWAERASAAHARPIGTSTRLAGPLADFAAIAVAIDTPARAAGMPSVRRTDDGASLLVPVVTESHDSTADPGAEGTAETETETETESAAERALQLDDAIAAYRAELADASRTLDPMVRARARLDLAETLVGRAELVEGAGCVLLLREAVAECAAAESVFAARSADDWRRYATDLHAAIQGALADAERDAGHAAEDMGGHVAGPAGAALAENAAAGAGAARAGVLTVIPESPPSTERAGLVLAAPADDLAPLALVPTEDAHAGASADLAPAAVAVDAESDALPPYVGGASGLDATDIVWEVYEVYDDELDDADGDDLLAARPRP